MTLTDYLLIAFTASLLLHLWANLEIIRQDTLAWWRGDWKKRAREWPVMWKVTEKAGQEVAKWMREVGFTTPTTLFNDDKIRAREVRWRIMKALQESLESPAGKEETHEAGESSPQNPA